MGSMREALKAGCKLASIDTPITMSAGHRNLPSASIVGARIRSRRLAEIECELPEVKTEYNSQRSRNGRPARRPTPSNKPSTRNERENLPRQRADGGDRADLAHPLIHRHDHDVQNADQHDGDQHQLDEHRHQIDHIARCWRTAKVRPSVNLEAPPFSALCDPGQARPEPLRATASTCVKDFTR